MVELGGADIAGVGLGEDGDEHGDTPVVVEQAQHQAHSSQHHHPAKPNNFNRDQIMNSENKMLIMIVMNISVAKCRVGQRVL